MSKKKIKATELTDADCRFISLVPKGANRIPIRVMKSKEGTTMLKGFEGVFKKEVSTAYVASFVVNKGADLELARAKIEKAGFSVKDVEDREGLTVYHQKTAPKDLEHQYVVKTSDDIGVHVVCTKEFVPYDYETTSFKELFAKSGVLPNIFMAHEVLKEVIMNTLYSPDTKTSVDAANVIKQALSEFAMIVEGMVENIPVSAFKIEDPNLIAEVTKQLEKKEEPSPEKDNTAKEDHENLEEGEEGEEVEQLDSEEDKQDEPEAVEKQDEPEAIEKEDQSEVLKAIKDLSGEVSSLKESVSGLDEIKKGLTALEGRVEEVSKVAKSADEALNGVTNADPEGDRATFVKSDSKQKSVLKDTAYARIK